MLGSSIGVPNFMESKNKKIVLCSFIIWCEEEWEEQADVLSSKNQAL